MHHSICTYPLYVWVYNNTNNVHTLFCSSHHQIKITYCICKNNLTSFSNLFIFCLYSVFFPSSKIVCFVNSIIHENIYNILTRFPVSFVFFFFSILQITRLVISRDSASLTPVIFANFSTLKNTSAGHSPKNFLNVLSNLSCNFCN